jgi:CRP-like cAMP-binding protein
MIRLGLNCVSRLRRGALAMGEDVTFGCNRLFASMAEEDRARLSPSLVLRAMPRGAVLFHPGDTVDAVHFPCSAMVSLVAVMAGGETAGTELIGAEGAVGSLMSARPLPAIAQAVVQVSGDVLTLPAEALERAFARSAPLRDHFARYADCLLAQFLQSIACNRRHGLEQRLPGWLLSMRERLGEDEVAMTQERLAQMLGVQRTTVTALALELQRQDVIRYKRGRIRILDSGALAGKSCGCQALVRGHYDRIVPGLYRA